MKARMTLLIIGGVIVSFVGCTDSSDDATTTTELAPPESSTAVGQVPDAQHLAAMLLTEADLDGEWSVNPWGLPPTDRSSISAGEFKFGQLVCDDAPEAFRAAEQELRWQAFVHLDDPSGDIVVVEELLWADEPDAAESLYATLEKGLEACMNSMGPAGAAGTETWEPVTVPEVGDEQTGLLIRNGAEFQYMVLVRNGPVLMSLYTVARPASDNVEAELEQMIRTAAAKIT